MMLREVHAQIVTTLVITSHITHCHTVGYSSVTHRVVMGGDIGWHITARSRLHHPRQR